MVKVFLDHSVLDELFTCDSKIQKDWDLSVDLFVKHYFNNSFRIKKNIEFQNRKQKDIERCTKYFEEKCRLNKIRGSIYQMSIYLNLF